MTYTVDLAPRAEDTLDELPDDGRQEAMETIAAVLLRPGSWPALGGWDGALAFGSRSWVVYTACADGIEVYDVGWTG